MANPLGKVVSNCTGRRLAIGDIHGCVNTFQKLLETLNLQREDHLFLLGDYINKGKGGKRVLDVILSLSEKFQVFPLLGNHEEKLVEYFKTKSDSLFQELSELHGEEFLNLAEEEEQKYLSFLESLHYYFIVDKYILVHAGLNLQLENPFLGRTEMLNIRHFHYDSAKAQNKTIIHGHYPQTLAEIETAVSERAKIICLDNGCVYYGQREGNGHLLCLNLDTMQLIRQPNIE